MDSVRTIFCSHYLLDLLSPLPAHGASTPISPASSIPRPDNFPSQEATASCAGLLCCQQSRACSEAGASSRQPFQVQTD